MYIWRRRKREHISIHWFYLQDIGHPKVTTDRHTTGMNQKLHVCKHPYPIPMLTVHVCVYVCVYLCESVSWDASLYVKREANQSTESMLKWGSSIIPAQGIVYEFRDLNFMTLGGINWNKELLSSFLFSDFYL